MILEERHGGTFMLRRSGLKFSNDLECVREEKTRLSRRIFSSFGSADAFTTKNNLVFTTSADMSNFLRRASYVIGMTAACWAHPRTITGRWTR